MSLTVADTLKLPSLRLGTVVAGHKGLNRVVSSVSVLEVIDEAVFDFTKPVNNGDMLLTSFYSIKDDPEKQRQHLEYMYHLGDSCIVLYYVGIFIKEIHPSLIEAANQLDFPIIVMPENRMDFFYNEVIGEVYEAIFRDRSNGNDLIDSVISFISRLPENMRSINTLLRVISANLKVTLLLSDISHDSNYMSKWPLSNGITADTICTLYDSVSTKGEYCVEVTHQNIPVKVYCLPFTAFEFRNFSIYAVDELGRLTLDDMFKVVELLQIFSKIWDTDSNSMLENALVPAIIEGEEQKMRTLSGKLNIDIDLINTAMIIRPDFSAKGAKEQFQIKRDMIKAVKDCSEEMGKNIIVDAYGLYIIGFLFLSSAKSSDAEYIEALIAYLDKIDLQYTIAFFPNDDNVTDVRKTYLLYSEYISHAVKIFPNKKELTYGDILFTKQCYRMIVEKNEDYRVCKNILKPLLQTDEHPELLSTLAVYHLDTECEVKKTSEILFLHRNTVQYRLNKIREITNFRTDEILESYLMHTAIGCHRLEQTLEPTPDSTVDILQ
ncbi:hypothetical protein M2140_000856 [Clostridiales Family XIII bacterium PM5-7]